jgi:hypothetical protein
MTDNEAAEVTREGNGRAGREQRMELDKVGSSRTDREYRRTQLIEKEATLLIENREGSSRTDKE